MSQPPADHDVPRDKLGYELFLALRRPGCPICGMTAQAVTRHLESTSYENATDVEVRAGLRAAQGWCADHAQQWLAQLDALGTALIYKDVLDNVRWTLVQAAALPAPEAEPDALLTRLRGLMGSSGGGRPGARIAAALEPQAGCPACAVARETQRVVVGTFAGALASTTFLAAYRRHPTGVCLPHLRAVLATIPDPALVAALVEAHAALLGRISADLAEVIRKHDYRFRDEIRGAEFQAVAQAVEHAAGTLPNLSSAG